MTFEPAPAGGQPGRLAIGIFLRPGEYAVGDARHRVRTLLGSCVSITLWEPRRQIGAMSHFLLAERRPGVQPSAADTLDARYGSEALILMLRGLAALGVAPAQCEAKLFGGGDMFPEQTAARPTLRVGRRNGDAARALLEAENIRVVSHSLFGSGHRKIIFDIASGHVWSRQQAPGPAVTTPAPLDGIR